VYDTGLAARLLLRRIEMPNPSNLALSTACGNPETISSETPEGETARNREAISWADSGSCARANRHLSGVDLLVATGIQPESTSQKDAGVCMNKRLPNNTGKTFSETAVETVFPVQMPTERHGKTLSASR